MDHFKHTAVCAGVGIGLALAAWGCSIAHAKQYSDTLLWGIPLAVIGMAGYASIAAAAHWSRLSGWPGQALQITTHVLILIAAVSTVLLVIKAIKVELVCPGCILCWCLNAYLFIRTSCYVLSSKAS
ncbi:MAG: vitamin K epoxide reductase family protein [Patescibacteria group bacterium]